MFKYNHQESQLLLSKVTFKTQVECLVLKVTTHLKFLKKQQHLMLLPEKYESLTFTGIINNYYTELLLHSLE